MVQQWKQDIMALILCKIRAKNYNLMKNKA